MAIPSSAALGILTTIFAVVLAWSLLMRASCTAQFHGWREGLRSVPRALVGNLIAILATHRALMSHSAGGPRQWEKTHHVYPAEAAQA